MKTTLEKFLSDKAADSASLDELSALAKTMRETADGWESSFDLADALNEGASRIESFVAMATPVVKRIEEALAVVLAVIAAEAQESTESFIHDEPGSIQ